MSRIAYFVHNLSDPAVARRVEMLRLGGAEVSLTGFSRGSAPEEVAGVPAVNLGQTEDANLRQRAAMVARSLVGRRKLIEVTRGADVLLARNLEMLMLAQAARRAAGVKRMVYESLDIHRALLGKSLASRALRALERKLLQASDLLIYSSPAFLSEYFEARQRIATPSMLVENKLLLSDRDRPRHAERPQDGPPWTIGWFGNLRCRKTLRILSRLADESAGKIDVLIAGKPSEAEFPSFNSDTARVGLRYVGPYRSSELPALYGQCHFAWAIDYFEEGLNSTWLLPNRLYEAAAFGVVPIALRTVQTGRWLAQHGAGLLLEPGGEEAAVLRQLSTLDQAGYDKLRNEVAAISRRDLIADGEDCANLVQRILG